MKTFLLLVVLAAVAAILPVAGDDAAPAICPFAESQHAWGDADGDGLCDYTGLPVGECQRHAEPGMGNGPGSGECPNPDCSEDCDRDRGRRRDGTGPSSGGGGPRSRQGR